MSTTAQPGSAQAGTTLCAQLCAPLEEAYAKSCRDLRKQYEEAQREYATFREKFPRLAAAVQPLLTVQRNQGGGYVAKLVHQLDLQGGGASFLGVQASVNVTARMLEEALADPARLPLLAESPCSKEEAYLKPWYTYLLQHA